MIINSMVMNAKTSEPPVPVNEFEARYCYFDKNGRYKLESRFAPIGGTFEKPTTPIGDVPENVGYNPALTFQGWNFDDAELTNVTGDLDVGAIYIPTDEKTHIYIEIESPDLLSYTFYITTTSLTGTGAIFHFDFGDGTNEWTANYDNGYAITHTYATIGKYHLTLWIENRTINSSFLLGTQNTYENAFVGHYQTSEYNGTIKRIYTGIDIKKHEYACIVNLKQCKIITLHDKVKTAQLNKYTSLQYIIYPKSATSIGNFGTGSLCNFASIPLNLTSSQFLSSALFEKVIAYKTTGTYAGSYYYTIKSMNILTLHNSTQLEFGSNPAVTKLSTPTNMTLLSISYTYSYDSTLRILVMRTTTPPTLNGRLGKYCKIYVPMASLSAYRSATSWNAYANQMIGY